MGTPQPVGVRSPWGFGVVLRGYDASYAGDAGHLPAHATGEGILSSR